MRENPKIACWGQPPQTLQMLRHVAVAHSLFNFGPSWPVNDNRWCITLHEKGRIIFSHKAYIRIIQCYIFSIFCSEFLKQSRFTGLTQGQRQPRLTDFGTACEDEQAVGCGIVRIHKLLSEWDVLVYNDGNADKWVIK